MSHEGSLPVRYNDGAVAGAAATAVATAPAPAPATIVAALFVVCGPPLLTTMTTVDQFKSMLLSVRHQQLAVFIVLVEDGMETNIAAAAAVTSSTLRRQEAAEMSGRVETAAACHGMDGLDEPGISAQFGRITFEVAVQIREGVAYYDDREAYAGAVWVLGGGQHVALLAAAALLSSVPSPGEAAITSRPAVVRGCHIRVS